MNKKLLIISFLLIPLFSACKPYKKMACTGDPIPADAHYVTSGPFVKIMGDAQGNFASGTYANHEGNIGSCAFKCNDENKSYNSGSKSCEPNMPIACTPEDAQANGWDVSLQTGISGTKLGADISTCVVSACSGGYAVNETTKSCGVTLSVCNTLYQRSPNPGNYRFIARSPGLTDYDMCVAKYEAQKDDLLNPTRAVSYISDTLSDERRMPWTRISLNNAKAACEANGAGFRLISNKEWQATARALISVASNWSGGILNNIGISGGHSDNGPSAVLPAGGLATGSEVNVRCAYTHNTSSDRTNVCGTNGAQIRLHSTPNSYSIWDFAGNAWEWTSSQDESNMMDALTALLPDYFIYVSQFNDPVMIDAYGANHSCSAPYSIPYCSFGTMGFADGAVNVSGNIIRGGNYGAGYKSGIFASTRSHTLDASGIPLKKDTNGVFVQADDVGFRCVFSK